MKAMDIYIDGTAIPEDWQLLHRETNLTVWCHRKMNLSVIAAMTEPIDNRLALRVSMHRSDGSLNDADIDFLMEVWGWPSSDWYHGMSMAGGHNNAYIGTALHLTTHGLE